jgi:hypothetical protein
MTADRFAALFPSRCVGLNNIATHCGEAQVGIQPGPSVFRQFFGLTSRGYRLRIF